MIKIIKGDLLEAEQTMIAHQVNCQGVMGSGVAKAIKYKYPEVYDEYRLFCKECNDEKFLLGKVQKVAAKDKVVFNLFGQLNFGRGKRYTSYAHLTLALNKCFSEVAFMNESIAIPYKIGCDRGGGDWDVVYSIIEDLSELYDIDVYIYQL